MFMFLNQKWLNFAKSSGFKPEDSCVNQFLSISHEIYKLFGDGFDVRHVFLDTSMAFYKVWSEGI